jgi:hypothetical protein
MDQIKKIIKINLVILLTYTIIIQVTGELQSSSHDKQLFILITTMYAILAHLGFNILFTILFFSTNDKEKGKALALNSLLILLVGFSCCWGSAFIA